MAVDLKTNDIVAQLATELASAMEQRQRTRDMLGNEISGTTRAGMVRIASFRERQHKKVLERMQQMRTEVHEITGMDPGRIDWHDPSISFRDLREGVARTYSQSFAGNRARLREVNAESSYGQLLRYGVQDLLFNSYQNVPTVYQAIYQARASKNRQEYYAPLYGSEIPVDVPLGGHFDDSTIRGLDVVVLNKKVGRLLSIQRELVDDDQTGQITKRPALLGARMRYKEELDAMLAIVNANDFSTGAATSGYSTTITNAPGTYLTLSQYALETASIALRKMVDPMGNFMLVLPDTVLAGPDNEIVLYKLLNSQYQPSIPGNVAAAENIGDALSGGTGWTLTENWLKGRYTPVISVFLAHPLVNKAKAWWLMQAKEGAVFQERDPLEVIQEMPLSGQAFEVEAYRYRVRRRYRHAVIEPRFIYQGNDGSV